MRQSALVGTSFVVQARMPMPPSITNPIKDAASIGSRQFIDRTEKITLVHKDWKETIMFGISPLGWVHTLSSLPAIPVAIYMLARYGRIVPRSRPGVVYFISLLIGAITVFPIAHQSASYGIGAATILLLLAGFGIGRISRFGRAGKYLETIILSLTVFLLMVPTVSETLRRVPNGRPIVTDLNSPILLGSQAILFVMLIVGLTAQIIHLRRQGRLATFD
jgi:hypothetical protein